MSDDRRQRLIKQLAELGVDTTSSQVANEASAKCVLSSACIADDGNNNLILNGSNLEYKCKSCSSKGTWDELVEQLQRARNNRHSKSFTSINRDQTNFDEHEASAAKPQKEVPASSPGRDVAQSNSNKSRAQSDSGVIEGTWVLSDDARIGRRHSFSEKLIVATLALIFLGAGLASAALSGYANFHAFSASVSDPLQSRIWGWTGVIAAVISFGGFTLFYWHRANHRPWEGLRALIFALVGAGTSILGTQMYIAANGQSADAEAAAAQSNRAVIEAQIADWRVQLNGIPPGTRTVEGLEAYIAEVERVGKTEQKPYRDAKNELGLAKRRDELQARIDAANATLLGKGSSDILITAQTRTRVPDWIFAVILEIFSSQGTSIGLVALLLLFGRGQRTRAA